MNPQIAERWATALESGEFKQAISALFVGLYPGDDSEETQNAEVGFCCLGVLCVLAEEDGVDMTITLPIRPGEYGWVITPGDTSAEMSSLPEPVREWAGMEDSDGGYGTDSQGAIRSLAEDNDNRQSFADIANTIRTYARVL